MDADLQVVGELFGSQACSLCISLEGYSLWEELKNPLNSLSGPGISGSFPQMEASRTASGALGLEVTETTQQKLGIKESAVTFGST